MKLEHFLLKPSSLVSAPTCCENSSFKSKVAIQGHVQITNPPVAFLFVVGGPLFFVLAMVKEDAE